MAGPTHARSPRMAYIGEGGNVFSWNSANSQKHQLTWSWEESQDGHGSQGTAARLTHVWPAWAPDGSRIACFGLRSASESKVETRVYAVAADGVESWELTTLSGGMPVYGNWSPRGDAFAVLVQRGEEQLSLEIIRLDDPGKTLPVMSGAPLFWSWSPDGNLLAVHVGGSHRASAEARVVLLDAFSGKPVQHVTDHPGEFRVPAWSHQGDLLAYVGQETQEEETLFLFDVTSGEKGPVAHVSGGTAALWSADGNALAFSSASRSSSFSFSQIQVLDLTNGRVSTVLDEPVIGFFWSPREDALFYLTVNTTQSYLCWHRFMRATSEKAELVRFLPSREQTFLFSFFDQYASSHPSLAPDGSALAFAGYLLGRDSATTTSQVYLVPLDHPAKPRLVAPGQFVCWNL